MNRLFSKKTLALVIVLVIILSFAMQMVTAGAATAKMNYSSYTLTRGMTMHQTLKVGSTTVSDSKITWKSSDSSIASVDSGGNIKGLKPGTVTVSAKYSGKTYKSTITVKNCTQKYSSYTLTRGMTLHQTLLNAQGKAIADSNIVWKSSNTAVATVDAGGNIKGLKPGTAKISAKYRGVTYSKCTITVKNAYFNYSSKTAAQGKSFDLNLYNAQGKSIANSNIKWSSSDKLVATVSSKGYVTIKGAGTCYIRAKYRGVTYSCTVKGTNSIKFSHSSMTFNTSASKKLKVNYTDSYSWTIYYEKISGTGEVGFVSVENDSTSVNIVPLKKGSAKYKFWYSSNPDEYRIFNIQVNEAAADIVVPKLPARLSDSVYPVYFTVDSIVINNYDLSYDGTKYYCDITFNCTMKENPNSYYLSSQFKIVDSVGNVVDYGYITADNVAAGQTFSKTTTYNGQFNLNETYYLEFEYPA